MPFIFYALVLYSVMKLALPQVSKGKMRISSSTKGRRYLTNISPDCPSPK